MQIDWIHFYVEDAEAWRNWFMGKFGFQLVDSSQDTHTATEVVKSGSVCFVLSSPRSLLSPVAQFLRHHPPGVADIAFAVEDVEASLQHAIAHDARVLQPIQSRSGSKWGKIAAWGTLAHTLIEKEEMGVRVPGSGVRKREDTVAGGVTTNGFTGIDHVVLNVAAGDLEPAVAWYEKVLGFRSQQAFTIQTDRSALYSQVMVSSNGCVQLPINQPASPNSQIQEFLDFNRGAGIQHLALKTNNIVQAIAQFRACGVAFLPVPSTYYSQLQERPGSPLLADELQAIARQQILADWQDSHPHALLLQTFTQPIFAQPTFFFEIIERRQRAVGFGEGNFRALFEAIEREQLKRGSLSSDGC